jgi:integrase
MPRKARHLPPRMHQKHGAFYFVDKRNKWHRLGETLDESLQAYAERTAAAPTGSMISLIDVAMPIICEGLAENTRKQYDAAAVRLKAALVEFRPEDVKPKHVAEIKLAMRKTPNMANRVLSVLRSIFDERERDRYLEDHELAAIRSHAPLRLQCMIDILYLTGQRVGDVIGLHRSQITDQGLAFRQQKGKAKLVVVWSQELRAAVDTALVLHTNVKAMTLFHSRRGGAPAYKTVKDQWDRARALAGIPDATIHDVRAKSLTDAENQGLDPQKLGGHASRQMTERYIRRKRVPLVKGPTALSKKG